MNRTTLTCFVSYLINYFTDFIRLQGRMKSVSKVPDMEHYKKWKQLSRAWFAVARGKVTSENA
jgi:hypothetical protein